MSLDYEAGFRAGTQAAHKVMEHRIAKAIIEERKRCLSACASVFLTEEPQYPTDIAYQTAVERCTAAIMKGTLHV